jgi:hypothetical protein
MAQWETLASMLKTKADISFPPLSGNSEMLSIVAIAWARGGAAVFDCDRGGEGRRSRNRVEGLPKRTWLGIKGQSAVIAMESPSA